MKIKIKSGFLPVLLTLLLILGRKQKHTLVVIGIIFILFNSASLLFAQSIANKYLPDPYKDVFIWKENENSFPTYDSILTVLGRWAWGPCLAVDVDSNYAYIGNGPTFHVLDISDPSKPEIIGEYLTDGFIYDIEIKNNTAFLCIGRWFLILDISDPFHPTKISDIIIATNDVAISFALVDNFAYVTTFAGVMWVVDISELNEPYKRSAIAAGGQLAFCVEAKNGYVFIGNPEWPPMVIVDATNPDSLTRVDFEMGGWGYSAFIMDTSLFLGVHGYTGRQFKIYNVANAASPEFVGQMEMPNLEDVMAITISEDGQTAYARTTTGNIYSVGISDLTQPEIIGVYEKRIGTIFGNTGIAFTNNSVFSAHYNGLLTLDASQLDSLLLQSFYPTGGLFEKIQIKDSVAFLASGLSGLWILDVSNPSKPEAICNINTGGFTADLIIEDTLAYLVNWAAYSEQDTLCGLWIIDISNIYMPKIISHHKGITRYAASYVHPNSIAKSGNLIFITQSGGTINDSTLEIIDVSNPFSPITNSVFHTSYSPFNVDISDTIAFLATADGGVRIINISNPESPVEISSILDVAFSLVVRGQFLYESTADFTIIDVSDVYNPFVISSINTHYGSSSVDLNVSGDYAYWAEGYIGVIDISKTQNPIQVATFEGKGSARGIDIVREKIFFVDEIMGMWILKNNLVTSITDNVQEDIMYEVNQNFPNPFNSYTILEFKIPSKEKVLIEVFDLLGQKIQTIADHEFNAGKHRIVFKPFGLTSGIYFYRISTDEIFITKKMILVK